jgi:hypothetical protein
LIITIPAQQLAPTAVAVFVVRTIVTDRLSERPIKVPGPLADPLSKDRAEASTRQKIKALWQAGDLFHVSTRYPRNRQAPRVDRLAAILRTGLVAPARCQDGSVCSDLHVVVTGSEVAYDGLVFLHRFGSQSYLYTLCVVGRFAVFVDPEITVLTQEEMGPNWVVLCRDEVYVPDRIGAEKLLGVAVHPADAGAVLGEFTDDFRRLALPLYDYEGNVLWPPRD